MLRIWHKLALAGVFFCSLAQASAHEKFILLIPGFFNFPGHHSVIGLQYFSPTIVKTIREQGFTPLVIDNLDPVGSVDENGSRLLRDIRDLAAKYPGAKFSAIAHSAGGLYLARALTSDPSLPIESVVTISTPYKGAKLVDLLRQIPGFDRLTSSLNLINLQEFHAATMSAIWASLRIPQQVRWVALAAKQPACHLLDCERAESQSWLLSLLWHFSREDGDGVVSVDSSLGQGARLFTTDGREKHIETWPGFVVPLEHWEAVLDSHLFTLLGVANTEWIDEQQRKVFLKIVHHLNR